MASWERLVEVAAGLDPDPVFAGMDDGQLCEGIALQAQRVTVETARWVALVAEVAVRGTWADQGARSPGQWLSWQVGLASSTAREHVRVGLALRSLPAVRARFEAGTLSYSKVRAITRVADPASEELLLSYADSCPADELERIIARTRRACRAVGVEADPFAANAADAYARDARVEDVRVHHPDDGSWELRVRLDEVDGARLEAGLDWLERQQEDELPPGVRRALALLDAVEAALAAAPADVSGEDRDRLVVEAVAAPARAVPAAIPGAGASAEAPRLLPRVVGGRGPAMGVRSLRRLACTATAVGVTSDDRGSPLDVGRASRTATARQRRALRLRDGSCRFPGCASTTRLHAHHALEWGAGGRTDLDNLVLLCGFHHRFVHDAGWRLLPAGGGAFDLVDATGAAVRRLSAASAEAPAGQAGEALPVVRQPDTVPPGSLHPPWWDGEPIDHHLVVEVLARQLLCTNPGEPLDSAPALAA